MLDRSGEDFPNPYVTYQTAEDSTPAATCVFPRSDNPVWDHQHETKLSTELLFQENKVSGVQTALCPLSDE